MSTRESGIAFIRQRAESDPVPMFARAFGRNAYQILHAGSGEAVTRIDANVYPIDSPLSTRYEHPEGIVLTRRDCIAVGFRF